MDYLEADEVFFPIVQECLVDLLSVTAGTAFPKTYRAMVSFCVRTNVLKTALFDMVDSNNPYAFKALFRCLCDHHLKFHYVFVRFLKEESDDVGVEYYSYCGAMEARDYSEALKLGSQLGGNQGPFGDVAGVIAALYPAASSLSAKELRLASEKFRYRAILRYIAKLAPELGTTPFLKGLPVVFAEYSSFVHGGPMTDADMLTYEGPKALQDCREKAAIATMMGASTAMFSAFAMAREFPAAMPYGAKLKRALDQYRPGDVRDASMKPSDPDPDLARRWTEATNDAKD